MLQYFGEIPDWRGVHSKLLQLLHSVVGDLDHVVLVASEHSSTFDKKCT